MCKVNVNVSDVSLESIYAENLGHRKNAQISNGVYRRDDVCSTIVDYRNKKRSNTSKKISRKRKLINEYEAKRYKELDVGIVEEVEA